MTLNDANQKAESQTEAQGLAYESIARDEVWEKLNRGVSKPQGFPLSSGKVLIVSWAPSGLFLVGAVDRPRKRKGPTGKSLNRPAKTIGKVQKGKKGQKRKDKSRSGSPPHLKAPPVQRPARGMAGMVQKIARHGATRSATTRASSLPTPAMQTGETKTTAKW